MWSIRKLRIPAIVNGNSFEVFADFGYESEEDVVGKIESAWGMLMHDVGYELSVRTGLRAG